MSTSMAIAVLVAMLALNAFFVAAEFAMVSARLDQVEPMALAGRPGAKYALRGIEDVSVQLAATQLGITACSLVIGAVGESADSEAALGAHLHFAFFLDGEAVMPPMEEA